MAWERVGGLGRPIYFAFLEPLWTCLLLLFPNRQLFCQTPHTWLLCDLVLRSRLFRLRH